eukprot:COSAG06_NODE_5558_length_3403_cov_29.557506_5_plen_197_part_00
MNTELIVTETFGRADTSSSSRPAGPASGPHRPAGMPDAPWWADRALTGYCTPHAAIHVAGLPARRAAASSSTTGSGGDTMEEDATESSSATATSGSSTESGDAMMEEDDAESSACAASNSSTAGSSDAMMEEEDDDAAESESSSAGTQQQRAKLIHSLEADLPPGKRLCSDWPASSHQPSTQQGNGAAAGTAAAAR